jgi:hypothetical protein
VTAAVSQRATKATPATTPGGKREGAGRPGADAPRGNQTDDGKLDSVKSPKHGNDPEYLMSRLRRDHPTIAKLTDEQKARATLLAAVEVTSAKARELHEHAEDLADMALEIAQRAGEVAALAVRFDEAAIGYACEYALLVGACQEAELGDTCRCPSCLAEEAT